MWTKTLRNRWCSNSSWNLRQNPEENVKTASPITISEIRLTVYCGSCNTRCSNNSWRQMDPKNQERHGIQRLSDKRDKQSDFKQDSKVKAYRKLFVCFLNEDLSMTNHFIMFCNSCKKLFFITLAPHLVATNQRIVHQLREEHIPKIQSHLGHSTKPRITRHFNSNNLQIYKQPTRHFNSSNLQIYKQPRSL